MPRFCIACAAALVALLLVTLARPRPAVAADPPGPVSFIRDVAPLFQEQCFACHNARKKSGKYDMTRFESLALGGRGEPWVAGDPGESELHRLMVTPEERRMPPRDRGDAVPAGRAAVVARWIAEGAKLDAGLDPRADLVAELRERWQPPAPPGRYRALPVTALAFTPDGNAVVVGGRHELTVWSLPAGKLVKRVRTRMPRTYALAFLPDGTLAAAGGRPGLEGEVAVYDLNAPGATEAGVVRVDGLAAPGRVARLLSSDDSVLALAVSADGTRLAAGGCDRLARVWDTSRGAAGAKLVATVDSHTDWVAGVAFSPDGRRLATASRDKTAKVYDLKLGESVATLPDRQPAVGVAFAPGGELVASAGGDGSIRFWPASGDGKPGKPLAGGGEEIVALASAGALLVSASADGTLRSYDAAARKPGRVFAGLTDAATAATVGPGGRWVAGGSFAGEVRVWDAATGAVVAAFAAGPGD